MNKVFDQYVTPTRRAFYKLEQMGESPDFVLEAELIFERQCLEMERLRNFLHNVSGGQRQTLLELDKMIASFTSKPSTLSQARTTIIRGERHAQFSDEAQQLLSQIKKNLLALRSVREGQYQTLKLIREQLQPAIVLVNELIKSF